MSDEGIKMDDQHRQFNVSKGTPRVPKRRCCRALFGRSPSRGSFYVERDLLLLAAAPRLDLTCQAGGAGARPSFACCPFGKS
jgi:hypothetical protein